jgi:hypothetical protein
MLNGFQTGAGLRCGANKARSGPIKGPEHGVLPSSQPFLEKARSVMAEIPILSSDARSDSEFRNGIGCVFRPD